MKKLLTIFLLFASTITKAQTYDTVKCLLPVIDSTRYYDYREATGKLLWGKVKGYDPKLIPVGGYAVPGKIVKPAIYIIDAYSVKKENIYHRMETLFYLSADRKTAIKKPIMIAGFELPVNGFNFR